MMGGLNFISSIRHLYSEPRSGGHMYSRPLTSCLCLLLRTVHCAFHEFVISRVFVYYFATYLIDFNKTQRYDIIFLINSMLLNVIDLPSTLSRSPRHLMDVAYGALTRPMRKTGFRVVILYTLLTTSLAATDCEILNSGIPNIPSNCCTETPLFYCCTETVRLFCGVSCNIVCVNGRVTKMYDIKFNPFYSRLSGAKGYLPLQIGQLTELIEFRIDSSDLSAGSIPDSIGLCTKLTKLTLSNCKLGGPFPVGLRELKSLGMYQWLMI
jgi:hypothetical protein